MEDEFVETSVALMLYARTRTLPPVHFDLFSPWNEPEDAGMLARASTSNRAQLASVLRQARGPHERHPRARRHSSSSSARTASEPGMIITRQAVQNDSPS
jgi:hypothetical protein